MRSSRAAVAALGLAVSGALTACAGSGAPVCRPVPSWVSPAYRCTPAAPAAARAPAPLAVEDEPAPPPAPPPPDLPDEPPLVALNERSIGLAERIQFETGLKTIVESHISRLRGKVDRGFRSELIHTVRGSGYCVREPD